MRAWIIGAVALVMLIGAGQTQADLVTDSSGIPSPQTVVDFSQFSGSFSSGAGPVQVGGLVGEDIVWSSDYVGSLIGNKGYAIASNGQWGSGRLGYVASNSATATMRFDFNYGPVSAVGAFVNYAPDLGDFFMTALDQFDIPIEEWDITSLAPISTPGQQNAGAFRGIFRPSAEIYALELRGAFNVADDLTYTRTPVPEPSTLATLGGLLGMGLVAGWWRKRRKR